MEKTATNAASSGDGAGRRRYRRSMGLHRRTHQDKDIEKALKAAEAGGYRVVSKPKGYFKILCGCEQKRHRSVALTPSGARYWNNLIAWLKRCECGKDI